MKVIKKSTRIICVFAVIICVGCIYFLKDSPSMAQNTDDQELARYIELEHNVTALENELGSNTPYPRLYLMAEALVELKGLDEDKAIAESTDSYVEKKALVWYAENNGIEVTTLELETHINSLIDAAKKADNYDELNDAYKNVNSSLEEHYRDNISYYRDDYLMSKLYDQWVSKFTQGEELLPESKLNSVDDEWEKFTKQVIINYKESQSYNELRPALIESKRMYNSGVAQNVKKLKKANIFIPLD